MREQNLYTTWTSKRVPACFDKAAHKNQSLRLSELLEFLSFLALFLHQVAALQAYSPTTACTKSVFEPFLQIKRVNNVF